MKLLQLSFAAAVCGASFGVMAQSAATEQGSSAEMAPVVVEADGAPVVLEFPNMPYPEVAARKRETGTAVVALSIDAGGGTSGFTIERSSGSTRLDAYALKLAKATKFLPGTRAGATIASRVAYPVRFELKSGNPRETLRLASN